MHSIHEQCNELLPQLISMFGGARPPPLLHKILYPPLIVTGVVRIRVCVYNEYEIKLCLVL